MTGSFVALIYVSRQGTDGNRVPPQFNERQARDMQEIDHN
jgi:hypothetical protein